MATKYKVNYELKGDSTVPVTRTECIKHGSSMLNTVIDGKADSSSLKSNGIISVGLYESGGNTVVLNYSTDGINWSYICSIPLDTSKYGLDSIALFKFGNFYYIFASGSTSYYWVSKDFVNWSTQMDFVNLPTANAVWAPSAYINENGNMSVLLTVKKSDGKFKIVNYSTTIDNATGEITLTNGSDVSLVGDNHIDGYCLYDNSRSKYFFVCKNESNATLEIYTGNNIQNLTLQSHDNILAGIEAFQLLRDSMGGIYVYAECIYNGIRVKSTMLPELARKTLIAKVGEGFACKSDFLWSMCNTPVYHHHTGYLNIDNVIYNFLNIQPYTAPTLSTRKSGQVATISHNTDKGVIALTNVPNLNFILDINADVMLEFYPCFTNPNTTLCDLEFYIRNMSKKECKIKLGHGFNDINNYPTFEESIYSFNAELWRNYTAKVTGYRLNNAWYTYAVINHIDPPLSFEENDTGSFTSTEGTALLKNWSIEQTGDYDIITCGKNLMCTDSAAGGDGLTITTDTDGNIILNGTINVSPAYFRIGKIADTHISGTHTLSCEVLSGTMIGENVSMNVYPTSPDDSVCKVILDSESTSGKKTGTLSKNPHNIGVAIYNKPSFDNYKISVQLERGNSNTEHRNYESNTVHITESTTKPVAIKTFEDFTNVIFPVEAENIEITKGNNKSASSILDVIGSLM